MTERSYSAAARFFETAFAIYTNAAANALRAAKG
jgi:hypothetical protein